MFLGEDRSTGKVGKLKRKKALCVWRRPFSVCVVVVCPFIQMLSHVRDASEILKDNSIFLSDTLERIVQVRNLACFKS